ncbi:ly6/PLAUR domain-containing protein 6B isoform X2 [Paroedura picta]|uniref:ly6/PLAUR domain-containing protein 6B isoform X2 n=1 Tax=Paroedura picta TaxID=143630 RepID=UPI0040574333
MKLVQKHFRLNVWKKFLTVQAVSQWNRLPLKVSNTHKNQQESSQIRGGHSSLATMPSWFSKDYTPRILVVSEVLLDSNFACYRTFTGVPLPSSHLQLCQPTDGHTSRSSVCLDGISTPKSASFLLSGVLSPFPPPTDQVGLNQRSLF